MSYSLICTSYNWIENNTFETNETKLSRREGGKNEKVWVLFKIGKESVLFFGWQEIAQKREFDLHPSADGSA